MDEKQYSQVNDRVNKLSEFTRTQGEAIAEVKGDIKTILKTVEFVERKLEDHSEIAKSVNQMAISVEKYAQKVDAVSTTNEERNNMRDERTNERMNLFDIRQTEMGKRIGALEKRPGESAIKIIWTVVTPILTGLGGIIAAYFVFGGSA